jgi:hypothetical protein
MVMKYLAFPKKMYKQICDLCPEGGRAPTSLHSKYGPGMSDICVDLCLLSPAHTFGYV